MKFLANVLWSLILTFVRGAIIAKTWEWFVADTFDLYALSWLEATGFGLFTTFLIPSVSMREAIAEGARRTARAAGKPEPSASDISIILNTTYTISYPIIFLYLLFIETLTNI